MRLINADIDVRYLLPLIAECVNDDLAQTVLSNTAEEQKGHVLNSTSFHIEWARRIAKTFHERQTVTGPVALGDLVLPVKMSASWPLVVVDAQYNKIGVVDLDTGEPKYFGVGYVARLQGLQNR